VLMTFNLRMVPPTGSHTLSVKCNQWYDAPTTRCAQNRVFVPSDFSQVTHSLVAITLIRVLFITQSNCDKSKIVQYLVLIGKSIVEPYLTHSVWLQIGLNLLGFTFLVPAHPDGPGHIPEEQ